VFAWPIWSWLGLLPAPFAARDVVGGGGADRVDENGFTPFHASLRTVPAQPDVHGGTHAGAAGLECGLGAIAEPLRIRLGLAESRHAVSLFPLPASFQDVDAFEPFQNIPLRA
jgi:hypothetical protein